MHLSLLFSVLASSSTALAAPSGAPTKIVRSPAPFHPFVAPKIARLGQRAVDYAAMVPVGCADVCTTYIKYAQMCDALDETSMDAVAGCVDVCLPNNWADISACATCIAKLTFPEEMAAAEAEGQDLGNADLPEWCALYSGSSSASPSAASVVPDAGATPPSAAVPAAEASGADVPAVIAAGDEAASAPVVASAPAAASGAKAAATSAQVSASAAGASAGANASAAAATSGATKAAWATGLGAAGLLFALAL